MQFVYPGFLWGLLAICIPITIHLLQLRRPQRIFFTNTGFIREVELTTMRRRRLQELLVLLTRVLAVVALVLLFCQPFIPVADNAVKTVGETVNVLVDNSGSMQAAGMVQSHVAQEAAAGAITLGKNYVSSAHFKLLGQRGNSLSEAAYRDAVASQVAAGRQVGWGATTVRDALQDEQQGPLYLFSDFQKNEANPQLWQHIRRGGEVVLVPQVARPAGNIYVDSVWLNDAFVRAHTNVGLHIRLRNGGSEAVAACPVKILLGTQQVATFQVTVGAGQASEVTTQVQLPNANLALGQVLTGDAPVIFDNTYYFTLQPAAAIRVLEIGPEPVAQQAYAGEPLFTYSFAKPQSVNYDEMRRADLVLLREVPQVDTGLREALAAVVRRGKCVVVVPPASPSARTSYHEIFRALGIGGEQWETPSASGAARQEVAMPSASNPFFKDVLGAQPRQVVMPTVTAVVRLGRGGTDILRLRDGDGFLTEFSSGAGHAYVFAAPFAKEYSDFTMHSLFVPVLYRLAMLSYHSDQPLAYRLSTPALTLPVPLAASRTADEASYRLVRDSLTYIPAQRLLGGQLHLDVPTGLTTPGFYNLTKQGKVLTTLAFNADKRESELAAYSAAELRQLLGSNHPNVRVLEGGAQPETVARYRAEQTGQPLWRYCLLLALACLLAEALLLRFGRSRTGASLAAA
ncbi:BatA domain-containing protein [Hymenobacter sp. BRD128]|uniref:BatA domain-containing protein n=1 Tax=Hymenobacter sp. BRD128 TaxID=2675878 RepID=UPI001562F00D|nr:BatA domain-containing protein [Hymenobacter sp. BRD128]QKG55460.1 BatA domain-containing protein [Hymenobacter sp. BRD128]